VFITGEVDKPGPYPLIGPMSVLQLISMAGGLREYADSKKILIVRTENSKQITFPFNYKDVVTGKNLKQNIELKLGDTVVVP
jgi:polysaccharide export outer membrane protein